MSRACSRRGLGDRADGRRRRRVSGRQGRRRQAPGGALRRRGATVVANRYARVVQAGPGRAALRFTLCQAGRAPRALGALRVRQRRRGRAVPARRPSAGAGRRRTCTKRRSVPAAASGCSTSPARRAARPGPSPTRRRRARGIGDLGGLGRHAARLRLAWITVRFGHRGAAAGLSRRRAGRPREACTRAGGAPRTVASRAGRSPPPAGASTGRARASRTRRPRCR